MILMVIFVVSMNIFMSKGTRDTAIICTIKLLVENNIHFEGILGLVPIAKNSHYLHSYSVSSSFSMQIMTFLFLGRVLVQGARYVTQR